MEELTKLQELIIAGLNLAGCTRKEDIAGVMLILKGKEDKQEELLKYLVENKPTANEAKHKAMVLAGALKE